MLRVQPVLSTHIIEHFITIKHTKDLSETVGSDVINDLNGINYPARLILTAGDQFSIFEDVFFEYL